MDARLSADNLIPIMPPSVREEYFLSGDASILGFSPGVKHWLKNSQHPRVEKWRSDVKHETARQIRVALKEQERMSEYARAAYDGAKGSVRPRAVIHPTIKQWMETKHGRDTFADRESIADTERQAPKLFFNK